MRPLLPRVLLLGAVLGCAAGGCAGPGCADPAAPEGAAVREALPGARPAHGGSLVIDPASFAAWIADADNHALYRVDLVSLEAVTTPLDGTPEQIAVVGDGRLAVTLRDRNEVALLDVAPDGSASVAATAEVPCDPFGLAVTPQREILVTSAYCHAVTALDAGTLEERWSVDVAREPRAVVSTVDGGRAFVTHLEGDAITVLDLDDPKPTPRRVRALGGLYRNRVDAAIGAGTLHPSAALAYAAVLSPSGGRLFVPHLAEQNGASTTRSIPAAYGGVPVEEETSFASVAVVETKEERAVGGGAGLAPGAGAGEGGVRGRGACGLRGGAAAGGAQAGAGGGDRGGSAPGRVAGDGRAVRAGRARARPGDAA